MSQSIDRLENLIRVLRGVEPDELNMHSWCNGAVGHVTRDQYFIDEGLRLMSIGDSQMAAVAEFFGISGNKAYATFLSSGYVGPDALGHLPPRHPTPADVIARLQVFLLEKLAAEAYSHIHANLPRAYLRGRVTDL